MKKSFVFVSFTIFTLAATSRVDAMMVPLPTTEVNYKKSIFSRPIGSCADFAHPVRQREASTEFYVPAEQEPLLIEQQYTVMFKGQTQRPFYLKTGNQASVQAMASAKLDAIEKVKDLLAEYGQNEQRPLKEILTELFEGMANEIPPYICASYFFSTNPYGYKFVNEYYGKSSLELAKALGIDNLLTELYQRHSGVLPKNFKEICKRKTLLEESEYERPLAVITGSSSLLHGCPEKICKALIDFLLFNLYSEEKLNKLVPDVIYPKNQQDREELQRITGEKYNKWKEYASSVLIIQQYSPKQLLDKSFTDKLRKIASPIDPSQITMYEVHDSRLSYCFNWDGMNNTKIDTYGQWFDDMLIDGRSLLYRLRDQNAIHQYMIQKRLSPRQMADLLAHDSYVARNRCATHLAEEINKRLMALLTDRRSWVMVSLPKGTTLVNQEIFSRQMAHLMFEGCVATHADQPIPESIQINKPMEVLFDEAKKVVARNVSKALVETTGKKGRELQVSFDGMKGIVEAETRPLISNIDHIKPDTSINIRDYGWQMFYGNANALKHDNTCFFNSSMPFYVRNNIFNGVLWIISLIKSNIRGISTNLDMLQIGASMLENTFAGPFVDALFGINIINVNLETMGIDPVDESIFYGPMIGIVCQNRHWRNLRYHPELDSARKKVEESWILNTELSSGIYDFTKNKPDRKFFFDKPEIKKAHEEFPQRRELELTEDEKKPQTKEVNPDVYGAFKHLVTPKKPPKIIAKYQRAWWEHIVNDKLDAVDTIYESPRTPDFSSFSLSNL